MATLVVTFAFPSDAQGFAATVGANTVASWQSADGSSFPPDVGCLQFRISGRNKTNANNTYSRTMTFEDMGVPAGATVTGITSGSAYFRCREWVTGATTNLHDGVFITPSGSSQITIASATSAYTNTSSWAQSSGVDSTGLSLASTTSCVVRWQADLATLNSASAAVTLACDTITFTVTYESGVSANPTTASATGQAGILDAIQSQTAAISGVSASGELGVPATGAYGPGLTLLLSLNLDRQDFFNGVASVTGTSSTASVGTISVTEGAYASLTGTSALGRAGGAATSDTTFGSLPIWSLVLDVQSQAVGGAGLSLPFSLNFFSDSDTSYKYSSDTLTPALAEDDLDEVWIEDDTEGFVPVLVHASSVQLGNSVEASVSGLTCTAGVGSVEAHFGSSTSVTGVRGVADASQSFSFLFDYAQTLTGVSGTSRVGTIITQVGGGADAEIVGVESSSEVGDIEGRNSSAVDITGVSATSEVDTQTVDLQLSAAISGVSATASVGLLTQGGDAIVSLTGLGVTGTAANMIINPGQEGRPIRRVYPGRGRTVRVGR